MKTWGLKGRPEGASLRPMTHASRSFSGPLRLFAGLRPDAAGSPSRSAPQRGLSAQFGPRFQPAPASPWASSNRTWSSECNRSVSSSIARLGTRPEPEAGGGHIGLPITNTVFEGRTQEEPTGIERSLPPMPTGTMGTLARRATNAGPRNSSWTVGPERRPLWEQDNGLASRESPLTYLKGNAVRRPSPDGETTERAENLCDPVDREDPFFRHETYATLRYAGRKERVDVGAVHRRDDIRRRLRKVVSTDDRWPPKEPPWRPNDGPHNRVPSQFEPCRRPHNELRPLRPALNAWARLRRLSFGRVWTTWLGLLVRRRVGRVVSFGLGSRGHPSQGTPQPRGTSNQSNLGKGTSIRRHPFLPFPYWVSPSLPSPRSTFQTSAYAGEAVTARRWPLPPWTTTPNHQLVEPSELVCD